jgi:hypothetical protein
MAALSAWGLYRFNQILQSLPVVDTGNLLDAGRQLMENTRIAYTMQYGEIFAITAVVCVVGALASLMISDRNHHDESDDDAVGAVKDEDSAAFPAPPPS